jgi:hypothetical protein
MSLDSRLVCGERTWSDSRSGDISHPMSEKLSDRLSLILNERSILSGAHDLSHSIGDRAPVRAVDGLRVSFAFSPIRRRSWLGRPTSRTVLSRSTTAFHSPVGPRARRNLILCRTNFWRRMANGWTGERRAFQAIAIRNWRPWERSTGPRSVAGKARASRNAWKGGQRQQWRALCKLLNRELRATAQDFKSA